MNEIVRIAAVAITAALCATVIRKQTPEIGIVLVLAGGTVIFARGPFLCDLGKFRQKIVIRRGGSLTSRACAGL